MTTEMSIGAEDAEEYTQGLSQIGAGWWRQVALGVKLGVPDALGLTTRKWVEERLGGYMKQSIPERREAVAELAAEGMKQREIADVLGVSPFTVNQDLKPEPVRNQTPEPESVDEPQVSEPDPVEPVRNQTPEPESVDDESPVVVDETDESAEPEPEPEPEPRVQVNEGDEWYTPRWLFDALAVHFAIDVCAPLDQTHSSVPAERRFTIEDDGLAQPWEGTVWCNPPYSKPEPWARRLIHHGDGLLLTHMPMNAGWCVDVWEACDGIRLFQAMEFVRPDGTSQRPGYWLQLSAFGPTAVAALARLQPLGEAAFNKRRVASPMWRRASS